MTINNTHYKHRQFQTRHLEHKQIKMKKSCKIAMVVLSAAVVLLGILALVLIFGTGSSKGNNINFEGKGKPDQVIQKTEQGGIHVLEGQWNVSSKYIMIVGGLLLVVLLVKWEFEHKYVRGLCRGSEQSANTGTEMETRHTRVEDSADTQYAGSVVHPRSEAVTAELRILDGFAHLVHGMRENLASGNV